MRQLTPAEIANLLGRVIQTQAQFYVARSSGGQPGQFLQINGVMARIMEPLPPGQVILVRYGDEWRAFAPRNPAPVVRVVQDVRRRQVVADRVEKIYNVIVLCGIRREGNTTELYIWGDRPAELVAILPYTINFSESPRIKIALNNGIWQILAVRSSLVSRSELVANPGLLDVRFINSSGTQVVSRSDIPVFTDNSIPPLDFVFRSKEVLGQTSYLPILYSLSRTEDVTQYKSGEIINGIADVVSGPTGGIEARGAFPGIYFPLATTSSGVAIFRDDLQAFLTLGSSLTTVRKYDTSLTFASLSASFNVLPLFRHSSYFGGEVYRGDGVAGLNSFYEPGLKDFFMHTVTESGVSAEKIAQANNVVGVLPPGTQGASIGNFIPEVGVLTMLDAFIYPAF